MIHSPRRAAAQSIPIQLDSEFLALHGREATERELGRIVCSVKFELLESRNAFRLLGPEMSYHQVDPHLAGALKRVDPVLTPADILSYTSSAGNCDLYFEDSWSGYFIAKCFEDRGSPEGLLLLHLDDHTDMMATLLRESEGELADPTSGVRFNPFRSSDWEDAVYSGAINIGNFITPFFYSPCTVHVRHLNNSPSIGKLCHVRREPCRYDLIPHLRFASIEKSDFAGDVPDAGTYCCGPNPHELLNDDLLGNVLAGRTIVHIDLDYFINDFNGASRGEEYMPDPALQARARTRLDGFFTSLRSLNRRVDRWLLATSPGFCSGYHWQFLLQQLQQKIDEFENGA